MPFKAFHLGFVILAASSLPALAATTQADADKVRDTLKPYLGPMTDQMKIVPLGDGFKISADFTALLAEAKKSGSDVSVTPMEIIATPTGANIWKLHQEGDLVVTAKMANGNVNEKITGATHDAILNLDLGIISESNFAAKSVTVEEDLPDPKGGRTKINFSVDGLAIKSTAKVNPEGGSDITFSEPIGAISATINSVNGKEVIDSTVKSAGGTYDGTIVGFKGSPMLSVWRFGIAHIGKKPTANDQGELKTALQTALPVFKSMTSGGSFTKIEVGTPLGVFGLDKLGVTLNATGLLKDGTLEEGLSVEGLNLPPGIAPPWAQSLVATNAAVNFKLSGFDLATWSKGMLDAADFTKTDVVPKNVMDKLALSILPNGVATITLGPSSISNSSYNLSADGSFSAGPAAMPTGKSTVKLSGFDALMKAITGAPPESGVKDAGAVMIVAKGLSKSAADGSLTWDIEATPDGKVLVNGTDIKSLK